MSSACTFCGIARGSPLVPIVAESGRALAFLDHAPANDGHTLVLPRAHADDIWDLNTADGDAVWSLAREVATRIRSVSNPDGLTLSQANRAAGGQDVFHFHLHLIPRWRGDGFVRRWRPKREPRDLEWLAARLREG